MGHSVGGFQARNGQLVEYGVVQRRACVQYMWSQIKPVSFAGKVPEPELPTQLTAQQDRASEPAALLALFFSSKFWSQKMCFYLVKTIGW